VFDTRCVRRERLLLLDRNLVYCLTDVAKWGVSTASQPRRVRQPTWGAAQLEVHFQKGCRVYGIDDIPKSTMDSTGMHSQSSKIIQVAPAAEVEKHNGDPHLRRRTAVRKTRPQAVSQVVEGIGRHAHSDLKVEAVARPDVGK